VILTTGVLLFVRALVFFRHRHLIFSCMSLVPFCLGLLVFLQLDLSLSLNICALSLCAESATGVSECRAFVKRPLNENCFSPVPRGEENISYAPLLCTLLLPGCSRFDIAFQKTRRRSERTCVSAL
jgi:hypothetical protein